MKRRLTDLSDIITPEDYRAEISMLNHEVYRLNKELQNSKAQQMQNSLIDKYDPFDNPTDYHHYNEDYSDIVPQIDIPGCKIPVEPNRSERKKLRRFYNIGGCCMLSHFIFTNIIATILVSVIMIILQFKNPDASYSSLYSYLSGSSAFIGVNIIVYLAGNVLFSLIGLKWAGFRFSSIINTKEFGFGKALQYCFSAIFIQYAAALAMTVISDIFSKYGIDTDAPQLSEFSDSPVAMVLTVIYGCIIAPVTEELFFRGMLLKTFSRANQRFAAVATAVFFGLTHGNLPQFMLAFLLGIFLAHITFKHNSIVPAVITHVFVNTTATVINELSERYTSNYALIIINLSYLLMAFVGLILFIEFKLKNKLPATTPQQSRRGFAVASASVPTILAFVALAVTMYLNLISTKLLS